MKLIVKILTVIATLVSLTACNKGNDSQTPAQNMSAQCVSNPQYCNNGYYQQNPGFQPYGGYSYGYGYNYGYSGNYSPFNYMNNAAYLCNCPTGTVPTYNTYAGLGCVQISQVYGYGYAYFGYGANNQQWVNIPQVSNYSGYSGNGCYNGVVQSCLIDQPTSCSAGYTCRAQGASSRLGLCMSNNSTNYYPQVR